MQPIYSGDQVLVYDGQDRGMAEVLADALEFLTAKGIHRLDAEIALVPTKELVQRAHWGGVEVGFVGDQYPNAVAVTVVNLPKGMV